MAINNPQSQTAIPQIGLSSLSQNQPDVAGGLSQIADPITQSVGQNPGIMKSLLPFYLNYALPMGAAAQYIAPKGSLNTNPPSPNAAAAADQTPYEQFTSSPAEQQAKGASPVGVAKSTLGLLGDIGAGMRHEMYRDMGMNYDPHNFIQDVIAEADFANRFLQNPGKFLLPTAEKLAENTPLISLVAPGNVARMVQHPTDPHSWDMWLTGGVAGLLVDAVSASHDVMTRGSDRDWAKAIISVAQLGLLLLPIKSAGRFGASREMLSKQFTKIDTDVTPGQTFKTVTGDTKSLSRLALASLADQMATQPAHFTDLTQQIRNEKGQFAKMDETAKKVFEKGKQAEKQRAAIMAEVSRVRSTRVPGEMTPEEFQKQYVFHGTNVEAGKGIAKEGLREGEFVGKSYAVGRNFAGERPVGSMAPVDAGSKGVVMGFHEHAMSDADTEAMLKHAEKLQAEGMPEAEAMDQAVNDFYDVGAPSSWSAEARQTSGVLKPAFQIPSEAAKTPEEAIAYLKQHPEAVLGGQEQKASEQLGLLRAQARSIYEKEIIPARIQFAEMYGSKLEHPDQVKGFDGNHTPFSPDEKAVSPSIQADMQGEYGQVVGALKEWGDHGGWFQNMDTTQALEKAKATLAGGGQRSGFLLARDNIHNIIRKAGLDPQNEADWEKLWTALGDKNTFTALPGSQKLAVRYLRAILDDISIMNYQHSQTRLPITHWIPFESRQRALPGVDPASDPTRTIMDWVRSGKKGFEAVFDHSPNDAGMEALHAKYPDRASQLKTVGPNREALPIKETMDATLARFFNNVTLSTMGDTLLNAAMIPAQELKDRLQTTESLMGNISKEGAQTLDVKEPLSQAVSDGRIPPESLPPVLPEESFRSEQEAHDLGYVKIRGELGDKTWMNHQSAVYINDAVKTRDGVGIGTAFLKDLKNAMSREEVESAIGKTIARATGFSKSAIMYSIAIHLDNMAIGRFLPLLIANSGATISAGLKVTLAKLNDPAMYAQMKAWYYKNGGVNAYRHDLEWEHHFHEADGSDHGPGGMKVPMLGTIRSGYHKVQKNGLWKPIDDMNLVAALVAKDHFMSKGISEPVADMMAPRWGSDFGGQTNPLYMKQSWRKARGMAFFAPSWWASKMRMMEAIPLSSAPMRMTNLLAKKFPALDPIRLKSLNDLQMKEYMRLNRRQQMAGLMMAVTTVDKLNQIFAGHHAWDNPEGHMLNVCFDKYAQASSPASGKSVCTNLLPGIRQDLELLDSLGFGHPWGPMHLTSDDHFKQAKAWDKLYLAATSVIDGARRTGGKTISPIAGASMEGLLGADSYNLLTKSQIKPIDRRAAALSFVPGGLQAKQAVESGGPQDIPSQLANAALQTSTGMPSIYEVGAERPVGVTQAQYDNYTVQEGQLSQNRRFISQQLMSGAQDFQWWKNMNFQNLDKYTQLKADTFGDTSPSGVISKQRDELRKKYHLDEPMSGEMLAVRQDAFETEFDHLISNSSEAVKRDYWQTQRKQWTDADHLYWYAKHIDRQIQSTIDGQNGAKIRLQKAIIAQASQEGFSTAALDQMRQQMPELYLYNQLMKDMGKMSPLGALVAAARSPFSHLRFAPTPDQAAQRASLGAQGLLNPADTTITAQTEQQLVGAAKAAEEDPNVVASAGTQ